MRPEHLIVLRHGQTEMSEADVFAGSSDVPLSPSGRAQASAWAPTLSGIKAVCSPLKRAAETAALAGLSGVADDDLVEWDLGELEGQPADPFRVANPSWNLFRDGAPGGESVDAVVARADRIVQRIEVAGRVLVLVGHGQFSKVLAARLLGLPVESAVGFAWGPCRASLFTWRSSLGRYALTGWNRTPLPLEEFVTGNT